MDFLKQIDIKTKYQNFFNLLSISNKVQCIRSINFLRNLFINQSIFFIILFFKLFFNLFILDLFIHLKLLKKN